MNKAMASELFTYDFSQQNPGARERVYERFMAAQQDEDLFVFPAPHEPTELSDDDLEMLAAAGNVQVDGVNGFGKADLRQ